MPCWMFATRQQSLFLALGNLEAYRYNNNAYTALYKQISEDTSLEQYCRQMQLSANNKTVAIILCVVILLVLLVGYYILYFRHRLIYRYNLEQVLEINKQVFSASLLDGRATGILLQVWSRICLKR